MMLSRHFHTTRRDCLYMKIIILLIISVQIIMANICTFAKKIKREFKKTYKHILKKIKNRFYKTIKEFILRYANLLNMCKYLSSMIAT